MTPRSDTDATGRPPRRRIPDFFIVGHHKSGTTALYEMLRRHPQIFMPDLKEPRYFASDLRPQFDPQSHGLPTTLEDYLALFEDAREDQRAGEASPAYLRSAVAARDIAALQPAARCIAILREPASFVRSLHLQLVQEHAELEKDLARAVANEQRSIGGRLVSRYSDHVHYVEQLRRFHAALPREQLLVLIYDDFRRENEATVRRVLRFLDVDDTVPVHVQDANPTVRVRSLQLDSFVRGLYGGGGPVSRGVSATVKALTPTRLRRGAARSFRRRVVYGRPQPADERVMSELRARYRGEVEGLGEYLGRDLLELWGYDPPRRD